MWRHTFLLRFVYAFSGSVFVIGLTFAPGRTDDLVNDKKIVLPINKNKASQVVNFLPAKGKEQLLS